MNVTWYEFSTEDLAFNAVEKAAIMILWLVIQIPGNIMLVGIIQFDRLGGDPLKRRIQDQVRIGLYIHQTNIIVSIVTSHKKIQGTTVVFLFRQNVYINFMIF